MSDPIIDSHQHFWKVGEFDYPWMSPELGVLYRDFEPRDLEPLLASHGIAATVLVQASNSLAETRWLLSLADQNAFIAGVVGWVDLTSADVDHQIDEFLRHPKFKGVRHLVESESDDDWLVREDVLRGLGSLARRQVPYDLLVHTRHLRHVVTVASRCPDLRLVIDHCAKPPIARGEVREWLAELTPVAAIPGVHCKVSGLITEADRQRWSTADLRPYVDSVIELFGTGRLLYGSDWPVCLLAGSYASVFQSADELLAGLNDSERGRILGGNAASFYRL